jgi:mono/diheme cytochrome c family protein
MRRQTACLAALLLAAGCSAAPDEAARQSPAAPADSARAALTLVVDSVTHRFTLDQLRDRIPAETVLVAKDPSYDRRPKRYLGFPLDRVLALGGLSPSPEEVLYFQASDGYRATLAGPLGGDGVRGVIAFQDLEAEGDWEPVGAQRKSPGPFYLVWTDTTGGDSAGAALQRPWPYQLVRIEAVDPRRKYDRIYPEGAGRTDAVYRGYLAFVVDTRGGDQCIACHSLNLQGGTVGPELNVPRNITEYRDEATLIAFIRNSRSFRARSAMPAYEGILGDADIRDILAYLRWLRERKIQLDSARR